MITVGDYVRCIKNYGDYAPTIGLEGYVYYISGQTLYVYFIKEFYGGHSGRNGKYKGDHCRNFPVVESDNFFVKAPQGNIQII
jgi:hypothetical protein